MFSGYKVGTTKDGTAGKSVLYKIDERRELTSRVMECWKQTSTLQYPSERFPQKNSGGPHDEKKGFDVDGIRTIDLRTRWPTTALLIGYEARQEHIVYNYGFHSWRVLKVFSGS